MTVGIGVLGLGFMGSVHLRAYGAAIADGADARVVGVWDRNVDRRDGLGVAGNITSVEGERIFDPETTRVPDDVEGLLSDPEIDLLSICTHTDSHVELASAALAAGKHVLIEKPVCLSAEAVRELAERARAAGRHAIPAMCMRFWPGWGWLAEQVRDGSLGPLRSLTIERLGSAPAWSTDFYLDPVRSGDAMIDLHIHDTDFVRWLLGTPAEVSSTGSVRHLATRYHYPDGPALVQAEGGWLPSPEFPFRMTYRASFDGAVAEFDSRSDPRLALHTEDETLHPEIPSGDGYDGEVRHAIAVAAGETEPLATLDEAAAVMDVLGAERASLATGGRATP